MCPARNNSIVRCVRLLHQPKNKKAIDGNCVWVKRLTLVVLIQIEATAFFLCRRNPAGFHRESNPYI